MNSNLYKLFFIFSMLFFLVLILVFVKDTNREWKQYQREFYLKSSNFAETKETKDFVKNTNLSIKQILIPELNIVDRCPTCHMGVEDLDFKEEKQPYTYHKSANQHPFDKFGCTICHQGQGRATTKDAAHGKVKFVETPLLPKEYLKSSCGKCHLEGEIKGAEEISLGRKLFEEKGCRGCHKLGDRGGNIGPDLSHIGRPGYRNPSWLFTHFKTPKKVSPDTVMPEYGFTDSEAKTLTMFMLSLTDEKIVGYYSSKKIIPDANLGKKLFEEKGCINCHSISGKGGKIGPDLLNVGLRRSTQWIYMHFKDPQIVSPGTVMPKYSFTDDEIKGLTSFLLSLGKNGIVGYLEILKGPFTKKQKTIEAGKMIFERYGCGGCHGERGKGGVKNPNTNEGEVPSLIYVKEDYDKNELIDLIKEGKIPEKKNEKGPEPPLYMPSWRKLITDAEIDNLIKFLNSLYPQKEGES